MFYFYCYRRHDESSFVVTTPEDDTADEPKYNLRYLVKWQNYSHLHNTWETFEHLKAFKGFKRVENYIKSVWKIQDTIKNSPSTTSEELESLAIEKERQSELLEGYKQVERIIAQRTAGRNLDIDHEHRKLRLVHSNNLSCHQVNNAFSNNSRVSL